MARSLTTGLAASIALETSTVIYLIEINSSDGATYLATTPTDISWDSKTWQGIGGLLVWDGVQEVADRRAQGVRLELSGVDQSIITEILSYHMRGRQAKIYMAHLTAGAIVADPYEIFTGYLNDRWVVREDRSAERQGTVKISTRIVSRLAILERSSPVLCSLASHREMLRRSGAATSALVDTFFTSLPAVVATPAYWGTKAPTGPANPGNGTYVT